MKSVVTPLHIWVRKRGSHLFKHLSPPKSISKMSSPARESEPSDTHHPPSSKPSKLPKQRATERVSLIKRAEIEMVKSSVYKTHAIPYAYTHVSLFLPSDCPATQARRSEKHRKSMAMLEEEVSEALQLGSPTINHIKSRWVGM
jgi:hypothetical protein